MHVAHTQKLLLQYPEAYTVLHKPLITFSNSTTWPYFEERKMFQMMRVVVVCARKQSHKQQEVLSMERKEEGAVECYTS